MRHLLLCSCWLVGPFFEKSDPKDRGVTRNELRSLLEKARDKYDVPGLAAGISCGDKRHMAVVGLRKHGSDVSVTMDDHWHLGSNTKPITALLIALLIDLGLLDWDTPLEQIFPEHAGQWGRDLKKLTPAHLLTHTSGLPPTGPLLAFLLASSKQSPAQDREKLVTGLGKVKLTANLGEKYEYSNLGYVLLGAIIDRRGKSSWEEQLEKKILQPLGIKHWGLGAPAMKEAGMQPWPHKADGKPVAADGIMDNPPVLNSAGRIRMSVADYHRFLTETLKLARGEKGLLKPATAEKLFKSPFPASPHSLSGWLALRKKTGPDRLVLTHDGSNGFNYCVASVVPDENLALCVFTNQGGPGGPGAKVCRQIQIELRAPKK